jgi:hypothetical protein
LAECYILKVTLLNWFYSFQLDDFYSPPGPEGLLLKGAIWSPHRLFIHLTGGAFVLVVPVLYGAIYRALRAHALTAQGRLRLSAHLYCAVQGSATGSESGARKAIIFQP